MRDSRLWNLLHVLLALSTLALCWAAISHRPLFGDGTYFYFTVLDSGSFFWADNLQRLITCVLQVPAVLLIRAFPGFNTNPLASAALDFAYSLHPIVSLFFCFRILRRKNQLEYFIFPVFSFAISTQTLMGYPSLVLPETLSFYWPLFLLLIFPEEKSRLELIAILALSLIGCFAYEAGTLLFAVNFIFLLLQKPKTKNAAKQRILLAASQLITTAVLAARAFLSPNEDSREFMAAVRDALFEGDFKKFSISHLSLMFLIIFLSSKNSKLDALAKRFGIIISILAGGFFFYGFIFSEHFYSNPYETMWWERVAMVPVSAGIALLMGALVSWRPLWVKSSKAYPAAITLVCVALTISLARDLKVTAIWRGGYQAVMELRRGSEGCNILPRDYAVQFFRKPFFITEYWLPSLTMAPELSLNPNTIFYVEDNPSGDSCLQKGAIFGKDSGRFRGETARFNLDLIKNGKIFLYRWNSETAQLEKTEIPRR